MKTAIYDNNMIHLESYPREQYHQLYLEGKKGKLFCSGCLKPVKIHISMNKPAYFFHTDSLTSDCEMNNSPLDMNKEQYIEHNGFRMPKSRSISDNTSQQKPFRVAKLLPIKVSFTKQTPIPNIQPNSYLQRLRESNIQLDDNQLQAVVESNKPLLVLSGAGSGKTRVLTSKTAFLIHDQKVNPASMMLVTFTSKAANEMKERLLTYPDMNLSHIRSIVSGTFHSIFYRILMFHHPDQWTKEKILNKDWQREKIIRDAGREIDLNEKEFAFDLALQQIGFWKNSLIFPHQVSAKTKWEEQMSFLYKKYEEMKQMSGLFDFDDMLIGCYQLFLENPSLLGKYQERFQYLLIDEFQDINKVQYELIKQLSYQHKNVIAVGDDDQSIYSFRGSNPKYLLDFEIDFPNAHVIKLEDNYRSSHEIVSSANEIISYNKNRRAKLMKAQFSSNKPPVLFFPYDEEEEATIILTKIQEKIAKGARPSEFAILYRTNAGSRAIFERLANSNLPFQISLDTESFYDRFIPRSILAYLSLSINEDDSNALATILPSLFLKQSVLRDIKAGSILSDCSYVEALRTIKTGYAYQDKKLATLPEKLRSLKELPPALAIESISKDMGFLDYLKKRGSEGNKLEKGADDLKDLKVAAKAFSNIEDFLFHADHISAQYREMKKVKNIGNQAITLSTIHRAKGLEYDTVFVIGVVDGSIPHDFALEEIRNGNIEALEEERRLLYVAVTRAKHHLYLSIPEHRRGKSANKSRLINKTLKT